MKKLSRENFFGVPPEKSDSLLSYTILSMFLGSRFAYVTIYNWDIYKDNLLDAFKVWEGGLSYHGAVFGMAVGGYLFSKRNKIPPLQCWDVMVLSGSIGVFFGRVGNFINGELYGRITSSPLGVVFKATGGGPYPRHPSQLYEAVFEGLVVAALLWLLRKRMNFYGVLTGVYISSYGLVRYFIEFFREPDSQLGYYFGGTTTMGQILCLLMILIGGGFVFTAYKSKKPITAYSA